MRRGGSSGDDHVTEALGGRFQPEDTHIDEVVMEKTMGGDHGHTGRQGGENRAQGSIPLP
jgi:hypothetical protein